MSGGGTWGDLGPRLIWGVLLAVAGFGLLYVGGFALMAGLIVLAGLGIWELHRMLGGQTPRMAGGLAAGAVLCVCVAQILAFMLGEGFYDGIYLTPWIVPLIGLGLWGGVQSVPENQRWVFVAYGALFLFAVSGMFYLRVMHGLIFVLFLVGVVVASDIAGYFAGRLLGGPKFWPRISPKKTWSGTVAGWIAGAAVAYALLGWEPLMVLLVAPLLALAAQMGDIAESAIKRRVGVKDSSALIPGHGGVLDRFDAMAGAAALGTIVMACVGVFA
ncbi:phosphatidate cytidylyltransferase [Nioella nitratireducens]|uniref:phosphatidate cytidylyltransferase n=1 Tax=Nioella nitratireducens TaxID=1287720 RepID=UPI0008FD0901|nr:phosphatidate cytidylyltransferase [Nioella nitratireducens]